MSSPQVAAAGARPPVQRILSAFLLPLFFVVMFPLAYISATHAPSPNDLTLAVVGPDQVVGKIADSLNDTAAFSVPVQTDVTAEARSSVAERKVDGAIQVAVKSDAAASSTAASGAAANTANSGAASQATTEFTVTTYIAGGGGRALTAAVEAAATNVAKQLGTTPKVVDVAPLTAEDTLGTDLFYLLIYTSLGGYLVIIVLMQVAPKTTIGTRFSVAVIAAVVVPLIVFGLSSIFVGDYGASFGTISAVLGVAAMYVFTVSSLAILLQQFLGNAVTFGVMAFIVFLNFPSAGGAVPASMLPTFWQGVHAVYFGAGAFEAFRSLVYFGGHGLLRWVIQLSIWTAVLVLATVLVDRVRAVRQIRHDLEAASRPQHRHLQVEPRRTPAELATDQKPLTNGAGTNPR